MVGVKVARRERNAAQSNTGLLEARDGGDASGEGTPTGGSRQRMVVTLMRFSNVNLRRIRQDGANADSLL